MTVKKEGGQWYMRLQVRGRRIHEPTHAKTRAAALKAEAERRLELIEGEDPRLRKAPTLEEFSLSSSVCRHQHAEAEHEAQLHQRLADAEGNDVGPSAAHGIWPSDVDTISFPGSGSNANQALRTFQRMLSLAVERRYMNAAP